MGKLRNKWIWMLIAALVLSIASGCADTGNGSDNGVKTQNYANDGYLGITNSNPKIPGSHMASTYKSDADLMRQSIRNLPGVKGSRIVFNAADAYVTIQLEPDLQAREIPTVERQAASVLRFNFPRYQIHVNSAR